MQLGAGMTGQKVAGRAGLAGLLVAGVLAVTFGTGYTATRALSDNGSVWLRKGDSIAQINAPARRLQATVGGQLVAAPGDPLTISQLPDGTVFVSTPGSNQVRRINQSTEQAGPPIPGDGVVSGDGHVWAIETAQGQVLPLDPTTGQPSGKAVSVGAPIRSSAVAGGVVYVTTTTGTVVAVTPSGKHQTMKVGQPGDLLVITVAGGTPYVVDETAGSVTPAKGGQAIHLPGHDGASLEVAPVQPGPDVWLVRGNQLVDVQVANGDAPSTQLAGNDHYEAPVVMGGQVYVPDVTAQRVLVYDTGSLQLIKSFAVPAGAPGDPGGIEVVAKEGAVWVDEPSAEDALALTNGGSRSQTIDKGTGKGVVSPTKTTTTTKQPTTSTNTTNQPSPPTDTTPVVNPDPGVGSTQPATGTPVGTQTTPPGSTNTTPGTTPGSTTTSTSTTVPPGKTVTVPDVTAKAVTDNPSDSANAACALITGQGLTCKPDDKGKAPDASTSTDIAVSQSPTGGTTAKAGDSVTVEFYGTPADVSLPNEVGNKDYNAACATVEQDGFQCTANAGGAAPGGQQKGEVSAESPDPSTSSTAPAHSMVTLTYYTSLTQVAVPECRNESKDTLTCAPSDGSLQVKPVLSATTNDVACNEIYNQSVAPGTMVDWGTEVDVDYDGACATTVQMAKGSWADNQNPKNKNNNVWWVGRSDEAVPSGFSATTPLIGYIYEPEPDGSAKPGTVALYRFKYGSNPDYYTTTDGSFSHEGWSNVGVIGYVYPAGGTLGPAPYQYAPGVPDSRIIYAASYDTDPADRPGEYKYSETESSLSGAQITATPYWVSP